MASPRHWRVRMFLSKAIAFNASCHFFLQIECCWRSGVGHDKPTVSAIRYIWARIYLFLVFPELFTNSLKAVGSCNKGKKGAHCSKKTANRSCTNWRLTDGMLEAVQQDRQPEEIGRNHDSLLEVNSWYEMVTRLLHEASIYVLMLSSHS
jgi:hypothetical protein